MTRELLLGIIGAVTIGMPSAIRADVVIQYSTNGGGSFTQRTVASGAPIELTEDSAGSSYRIFAQSPETEDIGFISFPCQAGTCGVPDNARVTVLLTQPTTWSFNTLGALPKACRHWHGIFSGEYNVRVQARIGGDLFDPNNAAGNYRAMATAQSWIRLDVDGSINANIYNEGVPTVGEAQAVAEPNQDPPPEPIYAIVAGGSISGLIDVKSVDVRRIESLGSDISASITVRTGLVTDILATSGTIGSTITTLGQEWVYHNAMWWPPNAVYRHQPIDSGQIRRIECKNFTGSIDVFSGRWYIDPGPLNLHSSYSGVKELLVAEWIGSPTQQVNIKCRGKGADGGLGILRAGSANVNIDLPRPASNDTYPNPANLLAYSQTRNRGDMREIVITGIGGQPGVLKGTINVCGFGDAQYAGNPSQGLQRALEVYGTIDAAIDIDASARNPLYVSGSSSSASSITTRDRDIPEATRTDDFQVRPFALTVGADFDGVLRVSRPLAGNISIGNANGLKGLIVPNATGANTFTGQVLLNGTALTPTTPPSAPGPTFFFPTNSASIGGGSVGVLPFGIHLEDCTPAAHRFALSVPGFATPASITSGNGAVRVRFYGPIVTQTTPPTVTIEYDNMDGTYTDVTAQFAVSVGTIRPDEVTIRAANGVTELDLTEGRYRFTPAYNGVYLVAAQGATTTSTPVDVAHGELFDFYLFRDCNTNDIADSDEIAAAVMGHIDCNGDGWVDTCQIAHDVPQQFWLDDVYMRDASNNLVPGSDGVPDVCQGNCIYGGADFNNNGSVSVQDLFDFLTAWFAHAMTADINNSGTVTIQDLFDFLREWFAKCA